jgi:CxxC motif-containing protein (DUF1111 family)
LAVAGQLPIREEDKMKLIKILLITLCLAGLFTDFVAHAGRRVTSQQRIAGASTETPSRRQAAEAPIEAPAGFDHKTNGLVSQTEFDEIREIFAEREEVEDGLGPVYNGQSCGECHQSPVTGGIGQINELRAGTLDRRGNFVDAPGGSLISDRAIHPAIQERVPADATVVTTRQAISTLGDGFVEAIADETIIALAKRQKESTRGQIAGQVVMARVIEAGGVLRAGRFGWKNQHASLLSFSADAYRNEMGITSPLFPVENTSLGRSVAKFDKVPDPEDGGADVEAFATFMRATKAPPRAEGCEVCPNPDRRIVAGSRLFDSIGCSVCHVRTFITAPAGTKINGGTFTVPDALGSKAIHPFGDFLLHDIGTGDGIVQNGDQTTAQKMRTSALWGLRTRTRLMHDGASLKFEEAILRHQGEAKKVTEKFRNLDRRDQEALMAFLGSL